MIARVAAAVIAAGWAALVYVLVEDATRIVVDRAAAWHLNRRTRR